VFELEEELSKIKERIEKEREEKKQKEKEEKIAELRERYEVVKGIPEQIVEEEKVEVKPKEGKGEIPEIILKVERLDAKIATLDDYRKVMDEKISRIAEEIGELRSTFLALDKRFSPLEVNAERALKAVSEVMPEKIRADFQKIEREILGIRAEIERMNTIIDSVRSEEKRLMEAFEKIKNVENVLEISKKIEEKIARVEEASRYADRVSAKTEVVFSELSGKLAEIERQKGKISRLDELTKELVKTLDEISLKIPKFAEKVEVSKLGEEILGKIKSIEPESIKMEIAKEINSRVNALKEEVASSLKELEIVKKDLVEMPKKIEGLSLELSQNKSEIEKLRKCIPKEIPIEEIKSSLEQELEKLKDEMSNMKKFEKNFEEILQRVESLKLEIEETRKLASKEVPLDEIKTSLQEEFEKLKGEYEKRIEEGIAMFPEIAAKVEILGSELSQRKDEMDELKRKVEEIPEILSRVESLIEENSISLKEAENKNEEKFSKISRLIEELTKVVEGEIERVEKLNQAMNVYFKIFAGMQRFQTLSKKEEIEENLKDIREDVKKMKELEVFNEKIEDQLMKTFLNLSKAWNAYNKEVADLFLEEANKYSHETFSFEAKEVAP
jgi:chromosome segregation ATPase